MFVSAHASQARFDVEECGSHPYCVSGESCSSVIIVTMTRRRVLNCSKYHRPRQALETNGPPTLLEFSTPISHFRTEFSSLPRLRLRIGLRDFRALVD